MVVANVRLISRLRAATRTQHQALDEQIRLADADDYRRFLAGTLSAVELLEPLVDAKCERIAALRVDLDELATTTLPAQPLERAFATESERVGAAYVMEGSTLGGIVLADRVEGRLGMRATRYLRLRGEQTGAHWKAFLAGLAERERGRGSHDLDVVCDAARAAFEHYAAAYRAAGVL